MEITLNNSPLPVEEGATVATLVASQAGDGKGIAVAVNDAIVTRAKWADTPLNAGDRVVIIKAAYGG
ncbi:MAG: sulfur carrier protein ThiS [Candidatus Amulumruptor caecigallinarius]|nr:sulfur carrier protein ThiS [Candidatus Amulumruptor caecigallinarius]MCM1396688.1 sulfur carrier protein ThiS [Candidatus Amulumruptor caecigallinarius]MCM1453254.1 sulfur carrier protein ThiS [bacterium]